MGCQSASKLVQTSIDKDNLKEIQGKKYDDIKLETSILKNEKNPGEPRPLYGYLMLEKDLNNGSKLYIHSYYSRGVTSSMSILTTTKWNFSIFGFKVKDGLIQDWAYGLYQPDDAESKSIFFYEWGFDEKQWNEVIKKDYSNLIKTSDKNNISNW
tara:strand:- start:287 stop:751 length:465 start_codon:yes stop_codon:yes gene_type:complete